MSAGAAQLALDRFRMAVEAHDFPQIASISVSIGYTAIRPTDTETSAFGRADAALYVAKHQGRNQVRCYETLVADGVIQAARAVGQDVEIF